MYSLTYNYHTHNPPGVRYHLFFCITTMYRYLHQRNHCSKIKLILSINGHKQLLTHTGTRNGIFFRVMDHIMEIYSSKKLLPVVDFGRS